MISAMVEKDDPDSYRGPAEKSLRRALMIRIGSALAALVLSTRLFAAAATPLRIRSLRPTPPTAVFFSHLGPRDLPQLRANANGPAPYGLPAPRPLATRTHLPTPAETSRMRAEYVRIARAGEEIFDAPSWVRKIIQPALKAAFQVAAAEDIMVDIANGLPAQVPIGMTGDVVEGLAAIRRDGWQRWRAAVERDQADALTPTRAYALKRLESMHRAGLIPPGFEKPGAELPEARGAYARLLALTAGKIEATLEEARRDVATLAYAWRTSIESARRELSAHKMELALAADAELVVSPRAEALEAKRIYQLSLSRAKDTANTDNAQHLIARLAGMNAHSVIPSPNLGKQLRPSCTLHMLRGLLAALGIKKDLAALVREAREIMNDPYIASITAFDDSMQHRLFSHYGTVRDVPRDKIFQTLMGEHRSLKVRIEIGEPAYRHSLILEGLYRLNGKTYVALRDSTSYFPTRMELADFAKVLTDEPALYFAEAAPNPH